MVIRKIIKLPHETLRRKAHKVEKFDADLRKLVDDMVATMRDEPGVGLAAPQVDISSRLIVVEYPEDDSIPDAPSKVFVVANPEFTFLSEDKVMGIEGCLSVPNLYGEVERSQSIKIIGQNQHGKNVSIKASGWLARVFQHEVDHLNGVLFVDKAVKFYRPEELPDSD